LRAWEPLSSPSALTISLVEAVRARAALTQRGANELKTQLKSEPSRLINLLFYYNIFWLTLFRVLTAFVFVLVVVSRRPRSGWEIKCTAITAPKKVK